MSTFEPEPKEGKHTSEYAMASHGSTWGIIATAVGVVLLAGEWIVRFATETQGAESQLAIVAGAVVAMFGIVQTTLVKLGYIKARAEVKAARRGVD